MPSITVYPIHESLYPPITSPNPLPSLLHTPTGLAFLELQGTIHFPTLPVSNTETDPQTASSKPGTEQETSVGKIVFPLYSPTNPADDTTWMKSVFLYVGNHQKLAGEVKKLKDPIAVLRRRPRAEGMEMDVDGEDVEVEEVEIVEVVRYKVVFEQRPEPVGEG